MRLSVFLLLWLCVLPVSAAPSLQVKDAWVRLPPPGAEVGAAYMTLQASQALTLTKMSSPIATSVELHSMTLKNGVMEMRELPTLALTAGKAVTLAPGGLHVMLIDLKKPLKIGDKVALDLQLKNAHGAIQTVKVVAPVRAAN